MRKEVEIEISSSRFTLRVFSRHHHTSPLFAYEQRDVMCVM
jgi:hypothetical protein